MEWLIVAVGLVLVVVWAALFAWTEARQRARMAEIRRLSEVAPSELEQRTRQRAVVAVSPTAAFDGILWAHDDRVVVLRNAQAVVHGREVTVTPVDGEVVIPWSKVDHVQLPGGEP